METLDALESIDMLYTRLDDSVLATLKGLTELRNLGCGGTAMKGEVLAQFETMPKLGSIAFGGSFANESLPHLEKFPNLTSAILFWTDIHDADLELLPTLSSLVQLDLGRTKVTGPGLATLYRFENLERLYLTHSLLTDERLFVVDRRRYE